MNFQGNLFYLLKSIVNKFLKFFRHNQFIYSDELEYLLCIVSPGGAISWRPGNAAESELTFHSLYPWGYRVILSLLVCDDGKPDVEDEPSKRAHDGVEEMDGY